MDTTTPHDCKEMKNLMNVNFHVTLEIRGEKVNLYYCNICQTVILEQPGDALFELNDFINEAKRNPEYYKNRTA